jgi:two-component system response regulator HydG
MPDAPHAKILIADDEPLYLRTTAELLRKAGYECTTASDGRAALEALAREPFDLVLSDLNMPGNLKLELLREGRDKWPDVPLVVVTGVPSLPSAIESVRLGIADYLLKPVKYDDLLSSVRRALAHRTQEHGPIRPAPAGGDMGLIGESPPMRQLREIIERVAMTDANVLITGESGTGKEVVARAIHHQSFREGPFQVIDCTAVPEALFESVLFGHAKGAFTGAVRDQDGLLNQADGGTAFFDEIGELPPPLQAKLLRVIQEQTFTPVGKTAPVRVDTRFLCATNRDLEMEVHAGRFRRDLFYRLAVIPIHVPPLRNRGSDVLLLARQFLAELEARGVTKGGAPRSLMRRASMAGKSSQIPGHPQLSRPRGRSRDFSPEAQSLLMSYSWPGNVRELRNAVEHGLAMASGDLITPADLPESVHRGAASTSVTKAGERPGGSLTETVVTAEREYLTSVLRRNSGNVAASAREAGMSRQGLHKLLKKHGLDADGFRT